MLLESSCSNIGVVDAAARACLPECADPHIGAFGVFDIGVAGAAVGLACLWCFLTLPVRRIVLFCLCFGGFGCFGLFLSIPVPILALLVLLTLLLELAKVCGCHSVRISIFVLLVLLVFLMLLEPRRSDIGVVDAAAMACQSVRI